MTVFVLIISAARQTPVWPRIQLFADQFLYNLEQGERATREQLNQICWVQYQEAPNKEVILTRALAVEKGKL